MTSGRLWTVRAYPAWVQQGKLHHANLLQLFVCVNNVVDKGEPSDITYLDFQKAFERSCT